MWGSLYLQLHVAPLSLHVGGYESFVPTGVLEVPSLSFCCDSETDTVSSFVPGC